MEGMFYGLTTALVTPFCANQKIDFMSCEGLLAFQKECLVDQVIICGTTGEGSTVSKKEFAELVALGVNAGVKVVANVGTNCTQSSVERARLAKDAGAQGALVIVPYYNCPNIRGIVAHMQAVCAVGLPVMFYYHPKRTGVELTVEELSSVLSVEGIVAMKDASSGAVFTEELCERLPHIAQLAGDDASVLDVFQKGGRGLVSVLGNAYPGEMRQIVRWGLQDAFEPAAKALSEFYPLIQAVSQEVNPQGIKCLLSLQKRCENVLRLPLVPVMPEVKQNIERAMQETGLSLQSKYTS